MRHTCDACSANVHCVSRRAVLYAASTVAAYCDEKVANREIRVWHFVIEKGY
jgi:hypothetical protein